jgi:hypothetical protein
MSHTRQLKTQFNSCPDVRILARCMDCGEIFDGTLAFHFFEWGGQTGLETVVCVGSDAHPIARVQLAKIPNSGAIHGHSTAAS